MNHKIYVIVSVPSVGRDFDMYFPVVKRVGAVKSLAIRMIEEMTDNNFVDDGCKNFYYKSNGSKLDDNEYVKFSNIQNGTKLILY